jgi:hypothetical protein
MVFQPFQKRVQVDEGAIYRAVLQAHIFAKANRQKRQKIYWVFIYNII